MLLGMELLILAFAAALYAPDTRLGKILRTALIEAPVQVLKRQTPLRLFVGLIVFLILAAFVIGAPEIVGMIGVGDLSIAFDATVVAILISTAERVKSAAVHMARLSRSLAPRFIRRAGRNRRRGRRLSRPKSPPADEDGVSQWDWAFA